MNKIIHSMIIFIFSITASFADEDYKSEIIPLIQYITENSKYEYNGEELPNIILANVQDLCAGVYTPETLYKLEVCTVAGYYNNDTNTIYISNTTSPGMDSETFFEVVLLHELVHYLQYLNSEHLTVACPNALETDAYNLQYNYVVEKGYSEKQLPDMMYVLIASNCLNLDGLFGM